MRRRAVAKLMRLGMSSELRQMLKNIPVKVQENVKTEHIYLGEGMAKGTERMDLEIRVFLFDGKKMASIKVSGKVHIAPFGTLAQQERFAREATKTILSKMN